MFVYENRDLFIPVHRLPVVSIGATLRAAFLALNDFGVGGLIAVDGDLPLYAVGAGLLRHFFRVVAEEKGFALAAMASLHAAIAAMMQAEFRERADKDEIGLISVAPHAVSVTDELKQLKLDDGRIYVVADKMARRVGWLMTNTMTAKEILTPKPRETEFECEKGHMNKDADNGHCSQCPFDLKR
ncbi:MAG TPA: hypothetical protein VET85_07425 [Stellaceae bacterium]|nr:hypothetical protein [Stellaceae bacterium]